MSREFLSIIYDAPIMWRRINSIGIILDCNEAYARKLGYAKSEIIGKTIFAHVPASQRKAMNGSLKAWFETGQVEGTRLVFVRRDGTEFDVVLDATSLYDSEGNLIGSNTVIFDEGMDEGEVRRFLSDASDRLRSLGSSYDEFDEQGRMEFDGVDKMIKGLLAKNGTNPS